MSKVKIDQALRLIFTAFRDNPVPMPITIGRWRPRTSTYRIVCSQTRIHFFEVFRFGGENRLNILRKSSTHIRGPQSPDARDVVSRFERESGGRVNGKHAVFLETPKWLFGMVDFRRWSNLWSNSMI